MTIKPINDPTYEYGCDMCDATEIAKWSPPNWKFISVSVHSGGIGQLYLCQECQKKTITELLNRIETNVE